jgi:hypothetical protein
MNSSDESIIFQNVLLRKRFELYYPGANIDELNKENLLEIILNLEDKVRKLRDPLYEMTATNLVKKYLKSYKFPRLQEKLLKSLSDTKLKSIEEIKTGLYEKKIHKPERPQDAIKKLVSETRKNIGVSGSADVFKIVSKDGGYKLEIDTTNLSARLKKTRQKNHSKTKQR